MDLSVLVPEVVSSGTGTAGTGAGGRDRDRAHWWRAAARARRRARGPGASYAECAAVADDALYATGRIREIGCWAHVRRGFVEALTTDVRAALMVALIQQLYQVERAGADLDADAHRDLRHAESIPLLVKIAAEREQLAGTVLPKSPLGNALRYLTNQWAALQRFVEDGRLAIDNNRAENQLRVVALGRKNRLFAGSFEGARRTVLLYSLVQSCAPVDVPPFDYLQDILLRVATHPQRLIGQLTPKGWAETFGQRAAA